MMMTHGQQPNAKDVPPDQNNAIHYAGMSSIDKAERICALLSDGGEIFMPMRRRSSLFGSLCRALYLELLG